MRHTLRRLGTPLALVAAASASSASDLTLDGQTSVQTPVGDSVQVELTGNPLLPTLVLADLGNGPVNLFGESLPLSFTFATTVVGQGATDANGSHTFPVTMPSNPALAGTFVYFLGLIVDGADPNNLDFSNGAELELVLPSTIVEANLAGESLVRYPYFQYIRAINEGDVVDVAVDPNLYPSVVGVTADIYVTAPKTQLGWDADPTLVDVSSDGADSFTFVAGSIQSNRVTVDPGSLSAAAGDGLGVGYDVVVDLNQNGILDGGDLIDGYGGEAGVYIVHDLTQPGPYTVREVLYNGGSFLSQDLYYPQNIAALGPRPLVVVSHGNGHNYQWYDHIGFHLASYGYIVMSHSNNTVPGVFSASTTTLTNTDYFLGNLATIDGGALLGLVDDSAITWIGHSRGGEGIAIAYDRLVDGTYVANNFDETNIALLSSIAPTDFLGPTQANPHGVDYHLWVGQADADVNGCANNDIAQSFHLHDRAEDLRLCTTLHGVGHGAFHDGGGSLVASGPCQVTRPETHDIMRGYLLPLVHHQILGNIPAKDYLTRQWEDIKPIGAPAGNCIVVDLTYRDSVDSGKLVIDDFQTNNAAALASSGIPVSFTVADVTEDRLDDQNTNFTHIVSDEMNGMTYGRSNDTSRGLVFSFDGADGVISYDLSAAMADVTDYTHVSLRICQGTRHPLTIAVLKDVGFTIALVDGSGVENDIQIANYGGGVEEPYQRTGFGCGTGAGWANEFETIRVRLTDFLADGSGVDLTDIDKIELRFGPSWGSAQGRLGIDDLELTTD